jgi:hypothetical protein
MSGPLKIEADADPLIWIKATVGSGALMRFEKNVGGNWNTGMRFDNKYVIAKESNEYFIIDNATGNVGIGTTAPLAKLSVINGAILASGVTGETPTSGTGTRMMWIPAKSAFRAGYVNGTQWDDANVGIYSTAMGYGTIASGEYSTAMGYRTTASGILSTAMGSDTIASGYISTAIGNYVTASGPRSIAMGSDATASGDYSTAMGAYTIASGNISTAMGYFTTAQPYASLAIGRYNVVSGDSANWVPTEPLFIIGNGTDESNRSNAMTVLKNGNVGIGTSTPEAKLHSLSAGTTQLKLGYDASNYNDFTVQNNGDLQIATNGGAATLALTASGRVGIGITAPNTALDVNGAFSMRGMSAPAASPAGQGRLYFDSTANKLKFSENGVAYENIATETDIQNLRNLINTGGI